MMKPIAAREAAQGEWAPGAAAEWEQGAAGAPAAVAPAQGESAEV